VKLEFDVDPKLVRFVILSILVLFGVHYEELTVLVGL
jgi:phage shock protein PspC (stress-responsive transcriptional regulator)